MCGEGGALEGGQSAKRVPADRSGGHAAPCPLGESAARGARSA
jgi:hypothetical protein